MPHGIVVVERGRDDELWLARKLYVSVRMKSVETPVRALSAPTSSVYNEAGAFIQRGRWSERLKSIVEVYRVLNRNKLFRMWEDKAEESRFSYGIERPLRPVDVNRAIILGIIEYNTGGKRPGQLETEFLADLLNNPLFDLVAPPIVPKLPLKDYAEFIGAFLEVIESSRFLPLVVPYIPNYATRDVVKLFDYYAGEDRLAREFICVEFNGGNPISQYSRVSLVVRKALALERELGTPVVLHALNLKYGKATRASSVVPAKDLLIFAMGFDSFGWSHKRIPIQAGVGRYELAGKLLNRSDYGYYSLDIAKEHIEELPGRYRFTLEDVFRNRELVKLYNAERQALEAEVIKTKVSEGELGDYLASKQRVLEARLLDKVRKLQGAVRQVELA